MKKIVLPSKSSWQSPLFKFLIMTKVLIALLLGKALQLQAGIFAQTITLSKKNIPIEEVFKEIKKQTGYKVISSSKVLRTVPKVDIEADEMPLEKTLNSVLKSYNLIYTIEDSNIIIKQGEENTSATKKADSTLTEVQQKEITGVIRDIERKPLAGVSITVKGSTNATATDEKGEFKISTNKGDILVFSSIGFLSQEIEVGDSNTIELVLEIDEAGLEEVVVVGYGTQKKRDLTGSMTAIETKELEDISVASVSDALIGKVSGVRISKTAGGPGAAPTIRIRGTGSITAGNDPLMVIDGLPMENINLSDLDMNNIESINILKDASSAAIYGARASSGVILITTKKGHQGSPVISFNTYYGYSKLLKKLDVLSPEEYVQFALDAVNNSWEILGNDPNDDMRSRPSFYQVSPYFLDKSKWTYTDWQDEIYQHAPVLNSQIAVSGGSNRTKYRISGSFYDENGIIKTSNNKRYNFDTNLDIDLTNNVKLNIALNYSKVNDRIIESTNQWNQSIVGTALSLPGFFALENDDGSYPSFAGMGFNTSAVRSPMIFINEYQRNKKKNRIIGNTSIDYQIIPKLKFKSHFGFNNNDMREDYFQNNFINDLPIETTFSRNTINANGSHTGSSTYDWLWSNTFEYKNNWDDVHNLDLLLGMTAQKNHTEDVLITAKDFADNSVPTLNAGQISGGSTTQLQWSLLSYLSRLQYNYENKYFFNFSLRRDGSSKFGEKNKWGYFPSISGGWVVSEENFLKDSQLITFLKTRISYGVNGNNAIPNYGSIGLLSVSQYPLGNSILPGMYPSSPSNPTLAWEERKQVNLGLDVEFFRSKIKITGDIYQDISSNLLLNVPVPSIIGFTEALQNIGKVRNRGMEFSLNSKNIERDFFWSSDFNLSFNRNKVLQLGPSGKPIISTSYGSAEPSNITQVGRPIGDFYGYVFEGIYNTTEEIEGRPHLPDDTPGDPIVADINDDGKINANDKTILGNYEPDFTYGLNNTFKYKGFDLNILIQGTYGNKIMNLAKFQYGSMTGRTNSLGFARDRWRSEQDPGNGEIFKASIDVYGVRREPSTFMVEDGSYLTVRNITLGYNFEPGLIKRIRATSFRIYFSSLNPFTFTKYSGYNPEISSYDNPLTPGVDYFGYPLSKNFTLGFRLTF